MCIHICAFDKLCDEIHIFLLASHPRVYLITIDSFNSSSSTQPLNYTHIQMSNIFYMLPVATLTGRANKSSCLFVYSTNCRERRTWTYTRIRAYMYLCVYEEKKFLSLNKYMYIFCYFYSILSLSSVAAAYPLCSRFPFNVPSPSTLYSFFS